jgi:hypothetical protein
MLGITPAGASVKLVLKFTNAPSQRWLISHISIKSYPSEAILVNKGPGRLVYIHQSDNPETNDNFLLLENSH